MKVLIICVLLIAAPCEILADKIRCKNVACPKPESCPSDSYPKLIKHHSLVHNTHHLRSSTGEIVRRERAIAYGGQQRESIKIIPGAYDHHNRKRSITDDEMLIQYCCPRYECACKPNYCDQECPPNKIPVNTTGPTDHNNLQYGVPGNCCVPCKNSYCIHHTFRKHGDKWRGDDCTTCECQYGEVKCQQSYCNPPDCLSYKQIPGECCPVCDNEATHFCPDIRKCNIHCKYGYQRRGSCDLCECSTYLRNQTTIEAPFSERNITATDYNFSKDNTNYNDRSEPQQRHTHGGYSIQFWSVLLSTLGTVLFICLTVWFCLFRRSAKYSTVQIA